ncbi:MAG: oxygen-independent coproporphyrinogen III oxidase [Gammaproteobacteria bacterium]|nr:oxygen-independent coproporphyrinogen III oxidase [Gammaproteobacteria bacterium]
MTLAPTAPASTVQWDSELIRRYNQNGPRYTSYPSALQFSDEFDKAAYIQGWRGGDAHGPLSLYVHIPFCARLCYYCACNKVITKDRRRSHTYLQYLRKEMSKYAKLIGKQRTVTQMHWGGGTPTFLNDAEMSQLVQMLREHFQLLPTSDDSREYAIEIDPRSLELDSVPLLAELGFNRMSIGVQDFDPQVQRAVNRIQSFELTMSVMEVARAHGFGSINLDLIYGLPHQTVTRFQETLAKVISLKPERLSLFNYAHLPHVFKPQRSIAPETLPTPEEKLAILHGAIDTLQAVGYRYIGMDHFALGTDSLAIAQDEGKLHRNFQGYSTQSGCDLLGLGVSAISNLGTSYAQNLKELDDYYAALDQDQWPIWRGYRSNADDNLRRDVIMGLICHGRLDCAAVAKAYSIDFYDYFAPEVHALGPMQKDGLIEWQGDVLSITPRGRLLLRNVCTLFDRYLPLIPRERYSKMI